MYIYIYIYTQYIWVFFVYWCIIHNAGIRGSANLLKKVTWFNVKRTVQLLNSSRYCYVQKGVSMCYKNIYCNIDWAIEVFNWIFFKCQKVYGEYQDFVGISLDWIIVEGCCRWKLLSGNLYGEYIDFVLIRLFTAVFVQLISFRRNSFQSTHFYMKNPWLYIMLRVIHWNRRRTVRNFSCSQSFVKKTVNNLIRQNLCVACINLKI